MCKTTNEMSKLFVFNNPGDKYLGMQKRIIIRRTSQIFQHFVLTLFYWSKLETLIIREEITLFVIKYSS